ncbi:hypothetical protein J4480_00285 [Candidatus Woesearchaeota archaeon]|nr:hypothetical protein [Candidatus Woesearchaeota archaeon]
MFEEHRVIKKFKNDVNEHIGIIEDEVAKDNIEEAKLWLNELLVMKDAWQKEFRSPGRLIIQDQWTNPKIAIDTNSTKHLAKLRLNILEEAIARVNDLLSSKLRKKAA